MAYSSAAVNATDLALAAADKPFFVPKNRARDTSYAFGWRVSGSFAAGADVTDTNGSVDRAVDGFDHARTFPNAGFTDIYWICDFGAAGITLDWFALLGVSGIAGATVTLQIADDNAFSVNLVTLSSTTADTKRIVFPVLTHLGGGALQYGTVRYLRVRFQSGGAIVPAFGEMWCGTRLQMDRAPNRPYEPLGLTGEADESRSVSGIIARTVRARGRRVLTHAWNPDVATYQSRLQQLYTDSNYGMRPWVYVQVPATSPRDAVVALFSAPEHAQPYVGPAEREYHLRAIEQAPNFLALEG